MEHAYIVNVRLVIAVPESDDPDAYIADGVNETLREHQRSFAPTSCLLDYSIGGHELSLASVDGYTEGDAFSQSFS